MSIRTRAADYGGVKGLYIPPAATSVVVNDMYSSSVLSEIVNPDFDFMGLGLDTATSAVYTMIEDFDFHIPVQNQLNGERMRYPSPLRNGVIEMCHAYPINQKYSRDEAIQLNSYWDLHQEVVESKIADTLTNLTESNVLKTITALTRPENQGNKAGLRGNKIYLGDVKKPLSVTVRKDDAVTDFNVTASEVVQRLDLTFSLGRSAAKQKDLRVVASPTFAAKLRNEQAQYMSGGSCCIADKPQISGVLSNSWGFPILESHNLPTHYMTDGTMVEYVILVNPNMVAAPFSLDYLEWEKQLHDIHLIGNFRYGSHLMSGKGAAIAAVKYSA